MRGAASRRPLPKCRSGRNLTSSDRRGRDPVLVIVRPDEFQGRPVIGGATKHQPRVVHIGRTHCAVDYALSNCAAVEVDGGHVLIDTGPSVAAAIEIGRALEPWAKGDRMAIVYTHFHSDHVLGTPHFHRPGVPIIAQERFLEEVREQRMLSQSQIDRGARQFGLRLSRADNGIGPPLKFDDGAFTPLILPTQTFRDALDLEIGGVRFEFRAAPGETHDHLFVWLPGDKTLIAGDNVYRAFPNLSALRGSSPRPVAGWVKSLERMRDLGAESLILGHTDPILGRDVIRDLLESYRDAIAFVHDSVVRMLNEGATPDEMAKSIRLPAHLRNHPYLAEVYGSVATSVRGIYAGYVGWFDGNATNIDPLPTSELAARLLPRLGNRDGTLRLIGEALGAGDARWAAWLSDLVLSLRPRDLEVRRRKSEALRMLADATGNPLARNWYQHDAALLRDPPRPPDPLPISLQTVEPVPIEEILAQLPYRLRQDRAAKVTMTIGYDFPDTGKQFTFYIRRGVGEISQGLAASWDLLMRATEHDFKRAFVARTITPKSREFWQKVQFEVPGSGRIAPLRALRRLIRLDSCIKAPAIVPSPEQKVSVGENGMSQPASDATVTPIAPPTAVKTSGNAHKLRFYHMRNWLGMPMGVWWPLAIRNRFKFSPSRLFQAFRMSVFTPINTVLHGIDALTFNGRVRRAPEPKPPLFIVGHWRTGTTLLHELMIRDEQFSFPTTFQVMTPFHFLLTDRWLPGLLRHALPERRPMDNMDVGFGYPQEDEFALANMGVPSPYLKWAFPNSDKDSDKSLDFEGYSPEAKRRWCEAMQWLVRRLNYRDPRRLILKSPTHTARVRMLAETFPGAQFVHIVRNPLVVFPSTVHTWKQLWDSLGFQTPTFDGIEDYVLDNFDRMYRAFEDDRKTLDPKRLYELKYEDLVRDPVGEVGKIYENLGLEGFEKARPKLEQSVSERKDYRTNKHELPEHLQVRIKQRWRGYIERYGYDAM